MDWIRARAALWVPAAVLLGLALRSYHFARGPVVWHDEAALMLNVLGLSFSEMFGPLLHAEATPPMFLVAERVVVSGLGDGIFALRLLPFLASCAALIVFALLARRLLGPLSAALAVGMFAVSDRLLWHSCEAKPYSVDVLLAVTAAWWFARTESWPLWQRCVPAALLAPLAVWVSFPACFILGGLIVGLLPAAANAAWGGRIAFVAFVTSVGAAFLALALGPAADQRCDALDNCWTSEFPNWSRPVMLPWWVLVQTLEQARYCLLPLGQVLVGFAAIGGVVMWRMSAGRDLLAVMLVPLGLAFIASCLHKYPYGGGRVAVFAAPALCLLVAAGARHALSNVARKSRLRAAVWSLTLLPPFALTAYRVVEPWPRAATNDAIAFAIAHRQVGDPIFGNCWEHEYYLRHEPTSRSWQGTFEPREIAANQAWVIHAANRAVREYPFSLPPGWKVVERTAFERTSVFKLRRVRANPD
jgi:hypothetical protein